jgi:hypothetical protein
MSPASPGAPPSRLDGDEVARLGRARAREICLKALSSGSRQKDFRESARVDQRCQLPTDLDLFHLRKRRDSVIKTGW